MLITDKDFISILYFCIVGVCILFISFVYVDQNLTLQCQP
jgi:hypothetical protein